MDLQSKTLFESRRFHVDRLVPADQPGARPKDVVRHPGAVVILPLVDESHVCLIRNYRISVDRTLIELPAGTLELGESPEHSANRELAEETGYSAGDLRLLHSFFPSPGVLDERMHLFVAKDLTAGPPNREPDETIENLVVAWDDALRMLRDAEIEDAKTIVGLLYYRAFGLPE